MVHAGFNSALSSKSGAGYPACASHQTSIDQTRRLRGKARRHARPSLTIHSLPHLDLILCIRQTSRHHDCLRPKFVGWPSTPLITPIITRQLANNAPWLPSSTTTPLAQAPHHPHHSPRRPLHLRPRPPPRPIVAIITSHSDRDRRRHLLVALGALERVRRGGGDSSSCPDRTYSAIVLVRLHGEGEGAVRCVPADRARVVAHRPHHRGSSSPLPRPREGWCRDQGRRARRKW